MSIRRERREARYELHRELAGPAFYCPDVSAPVWIPITVRVVTKGDDPINSVMGVMEVRSDNPSFIFISSDAPSASAKSAIHHEMGTFKMVYEPKSDQDGIAVVKTERMRAENVAALSVQPPEIVFEDDDD